MVDIAALMKVLPVSSLAPDWVAALGGFSVRPKDERWQNTIWLLEPPAGQHVAYITPQSAGAICRKDQGVLDEIPGAYKDIDQVMANQADLVEVVHTLKQVVCVKG